MSAGTPPVGTFATIRDNLELVILTERGVLASVKLRPADARRLARQLDREAARQEARGRT